MKGKYLANVLIMAVLAVTVFFVGRYLADNRLHNFSRKYVLYVYPDTDAGAVIDSIAAGANVRRKGSLVRCVRKERLAERLQPGRYEISPSMSAVYAVRMLCNGWQSPQKLTLSGTIRSKGRLASLIGRQMMADSIVIDSLLDCNDFLQQFGFDSANVFALFLPDTYYMYWTASPQEIFARFRKEYDAFWTPGRIDRAEALGLDRMEVSVLASIVNGETLRKSEYPQIAGVYLNRLERGMKLQADPTVAFCFNYELDRILKKHTRVDSPYNTYTHDGLPVGPIGNPGDKAIQAALWPDEEYVEDGYLYFVLKSRTSTELVFSTDYDDFLENKEAYQASPTATPEGPAEGEAEPTATPDSTPTPEE